MIIFGGIVLFISIIFYITNLTISKPNKNVLLNTTLPILELENEEVLNIVKEFKKSNTKYLLISLAAFLPCFVINSESLIALYFFAWLLFEFIFYYFFLKKYITKIRKLKTYNNWFMENKHIISVDTEVSRMKNKMPISIFWFIPSFLISLGITLYGLLIPSDLYEYMIILGCTSIFITVISVIIYKVLSSERTKVYSDDSSINLACNLVYRRTWSIVFVILATVESIFTLFSSFLYSYMEILSFIMITLTMLPIFIGYAKIRNTQNKLLMATDNVIYTDDDEYWGILGYNNPNDSNLMVEKRIGIGLTLNFGNPKAKIVASIFLTILIITLLPVGYLFIKTSNSNFNLSLDNDKISINAPIYGIRFNKSDIKEVSLISSLPKGMKTNGFGTNEIALGNYKFDGYGSSKSFVHKDLDKIIVIKLSDKYVFLTGDTNEETDAYYKELKSYLNKI